MTKIFTTILNFISTFNAKRAENYQILIRGSIADSNQKG